MFSGGVGRFFEGNAADMLGNFTKLGKLDDSIEIFNGHEYTLSNLEWATKVEPDNKELLEYFHYSEKNKCTLPSTIGK